VYLKFWPITPVRSKVLPRSKSQIGKNIVMILGKILFAIRSCAGRAPSAHGLILLGSAMGALRVVTMASGIILSVLMARVLGPEIYGRYIYALSIAQVLAMPVLSGLPTLVTRQLAVYRAHNDWARIRGLLHWARRLITSMALAVVCLGAIWLWVTQGHGSDIVLYLLTLVLVVVLTQMHLSMAVIAGFEFPVLAGLPDGTIRPLLLLVLVGILTRSGSLSSETAMFAHVIAAFIAAISAKILFERRCATLIPERMDGPFIIEGRIWLVSLVPLGLIAFSSMINSKLDILMLGFMSSKSEVAIYGVALQIMGLVALAHTLILGIAGPRMARLWAQNEREEIISLIRSVNNIVLTCVGGAWVLVVLFGAPVIAFLVGPDYAQSAYLASLTSVIPLISCILGPAPVLLLMSHHARPYVRSSIIMAFLNGILNIVLIPEFGAVGAIVASVVSTLVFHILMTRDAYVLCGIRTDIFSSSVRGRQARHDK
jgi:O-antigen/teichoic acid export membrane protein